MLSSDFYKSCMTVLDFPVLQVDSKTGVWADMFSSLMLQRSFWSQECAELRCKYIVVVVFWLVGNVLLRLCCEWFGFQNKDF